MTHTELFVVDASFWKICALGELYLLYSIVLSIILPTYGARRFIRVPFQQ